MSRFTGDRSTITAGVLEERLKRVEQQLEFLVGTLSRSFVLGRLRIDRVAPTSSADIVPFGDLLYDVLYTSGYFYVVIDDTGTLEWRRIALNSF